MPIDLPSLISLFGGAVTAFILSSRYADKAELQQREIARDGVHAQGRIVRVWQPPLLGSVRVYFEYEPHGVGRTIRCCHVDRRLPDESHASLPSIGSNVAVRYLPDHPARAVIAKLVSRFKH